MAMHLDSIIHQEDFISEVKRRPAIWDGNSDEYTNKLVKRNAWDEIMVTFVPNFIEKSVAEKNQIGALIQRKWKSLRASYTRELLRQNKEKRSSVATGRKQYMFFDQLRFLEATTKAKTASTSSIDGDDNKESSEIAEDENAETGTYEENLARPPKRRHGKPSPISLGEENDKHVFKRMTQIKDNIPENMDEDIMFMMSLVPEIKKIPDFGRLRLKTDLMNLILNAQQFYNASTSFNSYGQNYAALGQYYDPELGRTNSSNSRVDPAVRRTNNKRKTARQSSLTCSPEGSELSNESLYFEPKSENKQ